MSRMPGLDLLRAIAIVWVMLFHSYIVGGIGERFALLESYGWIGVDLFFVLSGYLIGSQLLKPLSRGEPLAFGNFYLRRSLRVLPAYLVVLALYFSVPGFREADGIQPLWQFLTYTVNLLIDYQHNKAFSHVWSLCVEEHFYLLFPLLACWLMRRPSLAKFIGICVATVLAGMAIRGYVWLHELAPAQNTAEFGQRFIEGIYYPTYTRLDGLLAGVVLAAIQAFRPAWWRQMQERANRVLLPAGLLITALAMWLFRDRVGLLPSVIGYPLLSAGLALLVAAATGAQGWLGRLRIPGVEWLALTSYSLYLIHKAMFHLVETTLPPRLLEQGVLTFAIYAVAALLGGALLYYGAERPFLRLREQLRHRKAVPVMAEEIAASAQIP
ncbi:acyltransferase [Rhodanobacter sp. C01]|uniref:acyltransferase family protein n=1 Tax=Rhodanobacter sp. C01 TaxID=1945856 RepID=UPI0009849D2F|nr:acyltransferase [Rhodanobacter sp. C01]OOG49816.1 acyltransferase [Rhodanobacter sp. C01]